MFKGRWKQMAGPAVILLAAAVAVAPLVLRGTPQGADLFFHLASWIEAKHSILLGIPYPHWTPNSNFGAGEPRFVFYPPITWMIGAALGCVLPWHSVAIVFFFLLLAAMGLATRALALEVLPDGAATLAGCAAIFSGFNLLTFYARCDFAELTAGFWIPLLILFLLRNRNPAGGVWRRAFDGSTVPLALVVAGAWLSNAPVGLMASYMLAALAVTAALAAKSWTPLIRATVGAGLGLGLAAVYLVPALWEQRCANLKYAVSIPHLMIENSWLFSRHTDPTLTALAHDEKLFTVSWVAVVMVSATLVGALVAWMRGTLPGARRWWFPLLLIPFAVLLLMLPVSLPVWNSLPKLRYLQFSWRWLEVLAAPMSIFFAAAVWCVPLRKRIAVTAASAIIFVAISAATGKYWFIDSGGNQDLIVAAEQDGWGVYGKEEYAPTGRKYAPVLPRQPAACLLSNPPSKLGKDSAEAVPEWDGDRSGCNAFQAVMYQPEHKRIVGVADHAGFLILRLRSYPAWRVTVNGAPVSPATERLYGLMAVPVPEGPVEVIVDWASTPDVIAGRWISVLAVVLVTALCLLERRLPHPRVE